MIPINIFSLIFGLFRLCVIISGEIFPECTNENNGKFIEDPNNCLKYIYCSGSDSISDFCQISSPYFSNGNNCGQSSAVCGNRPILTTLAPATAVASTPTTTAPTTADTTIISPTTAVASTSTTAPTTADTTTLAPTSAVATSTLTTATNTAETSAICPSTDDPNTPTFISNTKSCSDYYLCYHGEPVPMHCANMLHFDMKQQKCDTAEHVQCQIDIVTPREQCQPHTVDVYPHPSNCNYYYRCELGYLMIMQCPFNEGWDYEKRLCVLMTKAKCFNSGPREEY